MSHLLFIIMLSQLKQKPPNKHTPNLADMLHSQNKIIPLAEFYIFPDNDLPFLNKNTKEANNRASILFSSMNKTTNTVGDSIVLSSEGSYEDGDTMLPGGDNVKSRGFPSLFPS